MKTSMLFVAGAILLTASSDGEAGFPIGCGTTIGPGEKVTLTGDIATCTSATNPALTIVGPATVDLAGFRVLCDAMNRPDVGILIEGKGVKLLTGSILNCGGGVGGGLQVAGEGKHEIENLVVQGSDNQGVRVDEGSDKNSFKRVAANGNVEGWEINSDSNKLEDVVAIGNDDAGFDSDEDGSKYKRATAVANGDDGFQMRGDSSTITEAVFIDSERDGILLVGTDNKLEKSVAIRNGFDLGETGISPNDPRNLIKKNRAYANRVHGIRIPDFTGDTTVTQNVALGHTIDLSDENDGGTCSDNQWTKNVFGTSDADGTPSPACIE